MRITTLIISAAAALCAAAGPRVQWLGTVHNYGAFDEDDGNITAVFRYVNVGDQPLAITSARATCGCTTPEFTRRAVEPGDTGTVSVTYNPTGRPGRFEKKVYVDMNTEPERSTLIIKGVVIGAANTLKSRFPVDAGAIRLKGDFMAFGDVMRGRAKTQFLDIYNATADTVTPVWYDMPPYLSVTPSSPTIAPGEQETYSLYLVGDKTGTYGMLTDTIRVGIQGSDVTTPVTIMAVVTENFTALTPGMRRNAPVATYDVRNIDFDRYTPGTTLTRTFTIRNTGHDPLVIRRAYSYDNGITVTVDKTRIKRNKTATVTVTVTPADNIINGRIQIITNDPANPTMTLRVTGLPAR